MTSFTENDGARLAYDISGSGPDLVLAHAGVTDRHMWDEVVPFLATTHRVIRYDLRGFGDTTESVEGPWAGHSDLVAVMDAAGAATATIVGVSMGGGFAIDTALEHPERVDRLVLVNPALFGFDQEPDPWAGPLFDALDAPWDAGDIEECARIESTVWLAGPRRTLDEMPPEMVLQMRDWLLVAYAKEPWQRRVRLDPPSVSRLGEIGVPTLAVLGELDIAPQQVVVDHLAANVSNATKATMAGVAHLAPWEAPAEFARLALEFMS